MGWVVARVLAQLGPALQPSSTTCSGPFLLSLASHLYRPVFTPRFLAFPLFRRVRATCRSSCLLWSLMEGWTALLLLLFYRLVYTLLPLARNTCVEDDIDVLPLVTNFNATWIRLPLGVNLQSCFITIDDLGSNSHSGPAGLRARLSSVSRASSYSAILVRVLL